LLFNEENLIEQVKLNLGCGSHTPEGWVNIDYALGARLAKIPFFRFINKKIGLFRMDWNGRIKIHDLRRPFPFDNGSVDIIYTSHTLEHFSKQQGERFLKECHRVLISGGVLRVVVPDLESIVSDYTTGKIAADAFLDKLCVICDTSGMGFFKRLLATQIHFPHKCMYDTKTMLGRLREIGFQAESRTAFDSDIPDIKQIESMERTQDAVIVEGRRLSI
jgi:predicted SAM-dependent methyltransferase